MTQETAKNILKEMHDKALFSERAALEAFFPEFKDDVDERIRKVIYGWIYIQPSEFFDNGFSKEEMLAWLEKQKYTKKDVDDAWLDGVASAKRELEKQGEQKSAWKPAKEQIDAFTHFVQSVGESGYASPYDNNTKQLYSLLNDLKGLTHQEVTKKSEKDGKKWIDEKVYWKEREELFEDGKQEVINNPMKYGLIKDEDHIANASKKVESKVWSEEDEICWNQSIEAATFYYGLPSETVNWLKSIKERVHPKSQWTGEDEIGFGDTLWAINKARTIAKDENDMGNLWYAEDWLKSVKERIGG